MRHGLRPLNTPTEAALNGCITNGSLGERLELGFRWQLRWGLTAIGQGQPMGSAIVGYHGPHQQHRFADHQPRWTRFDHLKLDGIIVATKTTLQAVQLDSALSTAPSRPCLHQMGEIR